MDKLDVLVVYNASVAQSAAVSDMDSMHPFLINSAHANYNLSYSYFLDRCDQLGLSAGLTTSADITGPGTCQTYWTSQDNAWAKINAPARSHHIFDKISPNTAARSAERTLLLSDTTIHPFNDRSLFTTFHDKLLTYQQLPAYALPTVALTDSSTSSIHTALAALRDLCARHHFPADFGRTVILKDRFGAGGNYVFKITRSHILRIRQLMRQNPHVSFILQPYLAFNLGYSYRGKPTTADIRLIFHQNRLFQAYLRLARAHDFRCNQHQGGQLIYVTKKDLPSAVLQVAQSIRRRINKPTALYALDFVISNSGHIYFLEGNIGPGITWDVNDVVDTSKAQALIRSIVQSLAARVRA